MNDFAMMRFHHSSDRTVKNVHIENRCPCRVKNLACDFAYDENWIIPLRTNYNFNHSQILKPTTVCFNLTGSSDENFLFKESFYLNKFFSDDPMIVITFSHEVAMARRHGRNLSVFESSCHLSSTQGGGFTLSF